MCATVVVVFLFCECIVLFGDKHLSCHSGQTTAYVSCKSVNVFFLHSDATGTYAKCSFGNSMNWDLIAGQLVNCEES